MVARIQHLIKLVLTTLCCDRLVQACSRVYYETANGTFLTGRTMDWAEDLKSDMWAFPRGMTRDGGAGSGSLAWTSKHGSVVVAAYNAGSSDGLNDAGLVANLQYLAEADYGNENRAGQARISVGAWLQYVLDMFGSVTEAVKELSKDDLNIISPLLPNGKKSAVHLSISDSRNDSAIFEYIDGRLRVHHSSQYRVMTNSPPYEEQLVLATYWNEIGGGAMLPGTHRAADRFVRLSWHLDVMPKEPKGRSAVASVLSLIRHISVPIGVSIPGKPNLATTLWRTVFDHDMNRVYFESTLSPSLLWVDLSKLDLSVGATAKKLPLAHHPMLAGEVSQLFEAAVPFPFI